MQNDEEVGRVAASTLPVVSRAIEVFIESLVKASSAACLSAGSRTIEVGHLKRCIESDVTFDYLKHMVEGVSDELEDSPQQSQTKRKARPANKGGGAVHAQKKKRSKPVPTSPKAATPLTEAKPILSLDDSAVKATALDNGQNSLELPFYGDENTIKSDCAAGQPSIDPDSFFLKTATDAVTAASDDDDDYD